MAKKKTKEVIGGTKVHGAPHSDSKLPCYIMITSFIALIFYPFVRIFPLAFASSALILVVFHIAKL